MKTTPAQITPDSRRGVELLEQSIRQQNSMAAYALGKAYLEGTAVLQDINKAVSILMTAAKQNNPYAGYLLGKLYYQGEVLPKDVAKALYYLEQSAGQKNEFAAYLAGKIYLTEEGTQDVTKAIQHLESAWGERKPLCRIPAWKTVCLWTGGGGGSGKSYCLSDCLWGIDRKLKRRIDEKKQAHGLRQG